MADQVTRPLGMPRRCPRAFRRTTLLAQRTVRYGSSAPAEGEAAETWPRNGIEKFQACSTFRCEHSNPRFFRSIGVDAVEA
jgi:hypothetical protein